MYYTCVKNRNEDTNIKLIIYKYCVIKTSNKYILNIEKASPNIGNILFI